MRSQDYCSSSLTRKFRGHYHIVVVGSQSFCRQNISRRYSYQLRDGHKTACLCVESTRYRYMDDLDAPKKWFRANVDTILDQFGAEHHITKEDLFLSKQSHHICLEILILTTLCSHWRLGCQ